MILNWIMDEMVIPIFALFIVFVYLIFAVTIPIGPMLGIFYLMDNVSPYCGFLFIVWFSSLPILLKPLELLFDSTYENK